VFVEQSCQLWWEKMFCTKRKRRVREAYHCTFCVCCRDTRSGATFSFQDETPRVGSSCS
jgi:hypothetical protein